MTLDLIDIKYFKLAVNGPYRESQVDIAAKCPICGDSKFKKSVKRLHLYIKGETTLIHCFNGDCELNTQKSLYNFLKIYKQDLLFSYKNEKFKNNINYNFQIEESKIDENMSSNWTQNFLIQKEQPFNQKEQKSSISNNLDNFKVYDVPKQLQKGNSIEIDKFLILRRLSLDLIKNFGDYYYANDNLLINGTFYPIKGFLVLPFWYGEYGKKMYGFNARSLKEKKFINATLNKNYGIWNFFNVDLNSPVFIFEAILDALSFNKMYPKLTNIIALNTAHIDLNVLKLIKQPVFCLDNDKVGIQKMIDYTNITPNANFLIYDENLKYKDFNEALQNNDIIKLKFEKGFKAKLLLKKLI